jgi:hypothetical protein
VSLFWHASPVSLRGSGPMGWWITYNGRTELAQRECLAATPRDPGDDGCSRCSWRLDGVVKLTNWDEIWRYTKCKP